MNLLERISIMPKLRLALLLAALLAVGTIVFWTAEALMRRSRKPALVVSGAATALIAKPDEVIAAGTVMLRNAGGKALEFKITPSCGCSEVNPMKGTVPPYGIMPIHVGVNLTTAGTEKSVSLTFATNDPATPTATSLIHASRPAYAVASPSRLDLGPVKPGAGAAGSIEITSNSDAGSNVDLRKCEFTINSSGFHFEFTAERTARFAKLRVVSDPGVTEGSNHAVLTVKDTRGLTILEVPIGVEVRREIVVVPAVIRLPCEGEAKRTFRLIVKRVSGEDLGELADIASPVECKLEPEKSTSRSTKLYMLEIKWDRAKPIDARVRLRFAGAESPCEVRIIGDCETKRREKKDP